MHLFVQQITVFARPCKSFTVLRRVRNCQCYYYYYYYIKVQIAFVSLFYIFIKMKS